MGGYSCGGVARPKSPIPSAFTPSRSAVGGPFPTATASIAYGCSLHFLRPHPPLRTVTAPTSYGYTPQVEAQWARLRAACDPVTDAAGATPPMVLRSDPWVALPVLRCLGGIMQVSAPVA